MEVDVKIKGMKREDFRDNEYIDKLVEDLKWLATVRVRQTS